MLAQWQLTMIPPAEWVVVSPDVVDDDSASFLAIDRRRVQGAVRTSGLMAELCGLEGEGYNGKMDDTS